jgi:transcription elongation factor Elf1
LIEGFNKARGDIPQLGWVRAMRLTEQEQTAVADIDGECPQCFSHRITKVELEDDGMPDKLTCKECGWTEA